LTVRRILTVARSDKRRNPAVQRLRRSVALLAAMTAAAATAQDNQRWVTDQLQVEMRRGQSTQHAITRMLSSGTAVELLEDDRASGYSRIRTAGGAEGWILSRYLQKQPAARARLPDLEKSLAAGSRQLEQARGELEQLRQQRDELRRQAQGLQDSASGLQRDLTAVREASAETLRIQAENRVLSERLAGAEQRIGELEAANRQLSDENRRDWFIAGGGVLGAGLVLGLVLPRIRWQKRSSWKRL
jgi:SH3 domain protein